MKKCASCSKDLPDAALHCVFCGAKQPPVALARTAFGYSNEQPASPPVPPSGGLGYAATMVPSPMPQPAQPATPQAKTMFAAAPMPQSAPMPQPAPFPGPSPASPQAKTMFADASQPGPGGFSPPMAPPVGNTQAKTIMAAPMAAPMPSPQAGMPTMTDPRARAPSQPPPMGMPRPHSPSQQPPYGYAPGGYAPGGYAPGGYPMPQPGFAPNEPWRESLKQVMLFGGLLVLVALAVPLKTNPLAFTWDTLLHGEGAARVPFLVDAALGVLGVIVALLPMPAGPRGAFAALIGLGVIAVPFALAGDLPPWRPLVELSAMLLIVPALLVRTGYPNAALSRIVVTLCVLAYVATLVVPVGDNIPLVGLFKAAMNGDGSEMIGPILQIARLVLVVVALIVWLPGPGTANSTQLAWGIMLGIGLGASLIDVVMVLVKAQSFAPISGAPALAAAWIVPTVCLAFVGYGLATLTGKQLR